MKAPSARDLRAGGIWRIEVARTGVALATEARVAASLARRLVGLLGRRRLSDAEALIFPWCASIHTMGMRMPIDAVFVDARWRVVALRGELRPWRLVPPVREAWAVIELSAGRMAQTGVALGDQLALTKRLPIG